MDDLMIHIAGQGRVGRALDAHFARQRIPTVLLRRGWEKHPPRRGILFLALPDRRVARVLHDTYSEIPRGLRVVHFAGGLGLTRDRLHLLHPFASITPDTDLSSIVCLWAGRRDPRFRRFLAEHHFDVIHHATMPGPGYHTAAVVAGNFVQYLYAAGIELLRREGFDADEAERLLDQLVATSLDGVRTHGIAGLTGPAARGDRSTILAETRFLRRVSPRLAALYHDLSTLIAEATRDGAILD